MPELLRLDARSRDVARRRPGAGEPRAEVDVDRTVEGLDVLQTADPAAGPPVTRRAVRWAWPRLLAVLLGLFAWQVVVWSQWRPDYLLPGPAPVLSRLAEFATDGGFYGSIAITMRRALEGFAIAVVVGTLVGLLVARWRPLRAAVGSLLTGLQTMPSIAWFPLAILLFKLSEGAILFVVVIGAAPSVAAGLLAGVDFVPPLLPRTGRMLGARGFRLYRHVIFPAALPGYVAGLKQGWAFAWRSLMAGELLVIIGSAKSLGVRLSFDRDLLDTTDMIAVMIVILLIGVAVDGLFGVVTGRVRSRFGLIDEAA